MIFSLIGVRKRQDNIISGNWTQDCIVDSLPEAIERAKGIKEVNSNMDIAVVQQTVLDGYITNLTDLS